ncbi:LPXTG cell wall anchor domain-containing protein [Corticicoccus populi]|uniref:LPXTG cell wall anchor domain-containing protein n=1 Tax=Corticicoccus populi TaxID=1812821 RepID=A0ABW5WZ47_9STAP
MKKGIKICAGTALVSSMLFTMPVIVYADDEESMDENTDSETEIIDGDSDEPGGYETYTEPSTNINDTESNQTENTQSDSVDLEADEENPGIQETPDSGEESPDNEPGGPVDNGNNVNEPTETPDNEVTEEPESEEPSEPEGGNQGNGPLIPVENGEDPVEEVETPESGTEEPSEPEASEEENLSPEPSPEQPDNESSEEGTVTDYPEEEAPESETEVPENNEPTQTEETEQNTTDSNQGNNEDNVPEQEYEEPVEEDTVDYYESTWESDVTDPADLDILESDTNTVEEDTASETSYNSRYAGKQLYQYNFGDILNGVDLRPGSSEDSLALLDQRIHQVMTSKIVGMEGLSDEDRAELDEQVKNEEAVAGLEELPNTGEKSYNIFYSAVLFIAGGMLFYVTKYSKQ